MDKPKGSDQPSESSGPTTSRPAFNLAKEMAKPKEPAKQESPDTNVHPRMQENLRSLQAEQQRNTKKELPDIQNEHKIEILPPQLKGTKEDLETTLSQTNGDSWDKGLEALTSSLGPTNEQKNQNPHMWGTQEWRNMYEAERGKSQTATEIMNIPENDSNNLQSVALADYAPRQNQMSPEAYTKFKQEVVAETVQDRVPCVPLTLKDLQFTIDNNRFPTYSELTSTAQQQLGFYNQDQASFVNHMETRMMGIDPHASAEERPVYTVLRKPEDALLPVGNEPVSIMAVPHAEAMDSLGSSTSFTIGAGISHSEGVACPSPLDDPQGSSLSLISEHLYTLMGKGWLADIATKSSTPAHGYVHGEFSLQDVTVVSHGQLPSHMTDYFKQQGIPYKILE